MQQFENNCFPWYIMAELLNIITEKD